MFLWRDTFPPGFGGIFLICLCYKFAQVGPASYACLIQTFWLRPSFQVFKFDRYKGRGSVIFEKGNMNRIMQVLEDGKISLTSMFSSKHVKPFREEAASWTVKLNEISGVIEQVSCI